MSEKEQELIERLVNKSKEAFIMGLEIYNKPTINYRIEGFSFFICNAWELMLKAYLIKRNGVDFIYHKNGDTISLSESIQRIYTDKKQPLRINLKELIKLRNIATHFVTEDDEIMYAPFFQSNIYSYSQELKKFFDINVTDFVKQNFLTLNTNINILTDEEIEYKYSKETALKYLKRRKHLEELKKQNQSNDLFIPLTIEMYKVNNKADADATYKYDKEADISAYEIKKMYDPTDKFNLKRKQVIDGIDKQINAKNLLFTYVDSKGENSFTDYTLTLITKYYNLYDGMNYMYKFGDSRRYSQALIDKIVEIITANPDVVDHIKRANKSEKEKSE